MLKKKVAFVEKEICLYYQRSSFMLLLLHMPDLVSSAADRLGSAIHPRAPETSHFQMPLDSPY
jgi:hypothetical protein